MVGIGEEADGHAAIGFAIKVPRRAHARRGNLQGAEDDSGDRTNKQRRREPACPERAETQDCAEHRQRRNDAEQTVEGRIRRHRDRQPRRGLTEQRIVISDPRPQSMLPQRWRQRNQLQDHDDKTGDQNEQQRLGGFWKRVVTRPSGPGDDPESS